MSLIIPYEAAHALMIDVQPKQLESIGHVNMTYARSLEASDFAVTVADDGQVLMCAGKIKAWEGRSLMWALLSKDAGRCMASIVRIGRRMIELHKGEGRIETVVRSDFEEAHRLAKLVGLEWHHHEEKYLPGGYDADIYLRHC